MEKSRCQKLQNDAWKGKGKQWGSAIPKALAAAEIFLRQFIAFLFQPADSCFHSLCVVIKWRIKGLAAVWWRDETGIWLLRIGRFWRQGGNSINIHFRRKCIDNVRRQSGVNCFVVLDCLLSCHSRPIILLQKFGIYMSILGNIRKSFFDVAFAIVNTADPRLNFPPGHFSGLKG